MTTTGYRVVLDLDGDERRDYAKLLGLLAREWGIARPEEVVLRALREAAAKT